MALKKPGAQTGAETGGQDQGCGERGCARARNRAGIVSRSALHCWRAAYSSGRFLSPAGFFADGFLNGGERSPINRGR